MELTFDAGRHEYRLNGQVIPSVTQLLEPLIGDAFANIKPEVLERKRQLGTAVHRACELDDFNELDEASLSPELLPYLEAWRRFRDEFQPTWTGVEWQRADPVARFAGTIDRFGSVGTDLIVADIKTGPPMPSIGVQLAGYERLIRPSLDDPKTAITRMSIHLSDDGKFAVKEWSEVDDHRCFVALLAINSWREKHV